MSKHCVPALLTCMLLSTPALSQVVHDPTEPTRVGGTVTAAVQSEPRWQLESTLVASDRRIASINGETVAVGDRVNDATVTDIQPHAVQLRVNGRTIELRLDAVDDPKTSG